MAREKSDLEQGLESLGKAFTGLTGRLLGPKAIGREELPPEPSISPEADAALEKAGEGLGRLLHAAGKGLRAHPMNPGQALEEARAHREEEPPAEPGWSPLATGLVSLGGGLAAVAEGVLDVVAPRKPKGDGEAEGAEAGTEDEAAGAPVDAEEE